MRTRTTIYGVLTGIAAAASLATIAAADEKRELKAHQHGRGALNIAIDGNTVAIELDSPAADIVGFESVAATPEQKAAVAEAKARLAEPLKLFVLPADAGCTLASAKIEIEAEEADQARDSGKHEHADVEAEYELTCARPAALTSIKFDFFAVFKGAQSLDVAVVTSKGQSGKTVTRDDPRLDLAGAM